MAKKKAASKKGKRKFFIGVPTEIRFGSVAPDGTIAATGAGSGDWTVTRTALGTYEIAFTGNMAAAPAVVVTSVGDVNTWTTLQTFAGSDKVVIRAFDYVSTTSAPVARDKAFSFVAVCNDSRVTVKKAAKKAKKSK